jgi:oligoribonuclease
MEKNAPPTKLLWLDLEMTGLDVTKEVIIEVAALVTDLNFQVLDQYEAVVQQPQSYLDAMDDWNKKHHGESGLTAKVPKGTPPLQVETELLALIKKHWTTPKDRPVLAGNSISQDRLFIAKYFSTLESALHYRMLDVSSWKVIFNAKYNQKYVKKNSHRALDDIRESIEELKFYLGFFELPKA